jgi:hypothetical protein
LPAEILLPAISIFFNPASDQGGNTMAKSYFQFQKRQKELAKKKKKEEKRLRKLENKALAKDEPATDEAENDSTPSPEDQ